LSLLFLGDFFTIDRPLLWEPNNVLLETYGDEPPNDQAVVGVVCPK
jgi:hypothetical protein